MIVRLESHVWRKDRSMDVTHPMGKTDGRQQPLEHPGQMSSAHARQPVADLLCGVKPSSLIGEYIDAFLARLMHVEGFHQGGEILALGGISCLCQDGGKD